MKIVSIVSILCIFFLQSLYGDVVICIHGFMRTKKCMSKMESSLRQEKNFHVYNWSYPSRDKSIDEHARDLNFFLNEIVPFYPDEPVHFVTHSLGGLIVRKAVNLEGCPTQAKKGKAVLIAPPNKGSLFAQFLSNFSTMRRIVGFHCGQELFQTKDFFHLGDFPKEMDILVISGTFGWNPFVKGVNDGKVGVKESCLSTPHKHQKIFASHSWICYTPSAIRHTKNFLQNKDEG